MACKCLIWKMCFSVKNNTARNIYFSLLYFSQILSCWEQNRFTISGHLRSLGFLVTGDHQWFSMDLLPFPVFRFFVTKCCFRFFNLSFSFTPLFSSNSFFNYHLITCNMIYIKYLKKVYTTFNAVLTIRN